MKSSFFIGAVSAALALSAFIATPVMAQEAAAPVVEATSASVGGSSAVTATRGQEVYTAAGTRLGRVLRVNGDGSIRVQVDGAINGGTARLSADTLSQNGENLVTSLTRAQVVALVR